MTDYAATSAAITALAKATPCDYCQAVPGADCLTATGETSTRLHEARIRPVRALYHLGARDGRDEVIEAVSGAARLARSRSDVASTRDDQAQRARLTICASTLSELEVTLRRVWA